MPIIPLTTLASRLPLGTLRLRLTLLYGGLFLASGAGLLAITYALLAHHLGGFAVGMEHAPRATRTIRIAFPLPELERQARAAALHQLLIQSGIALGIMAVVSIGLGWLVAGRALRPLRTMTLTTRQISADNLHQRLALQGPRELKELGDTIDGLLGRLDGAFDAQRSFVANASHELRTPLTLGRALIEAALTDPGATIGTFRSACEDALAAGEQQESLIEALLTLARSQRGLGQRDPVDLDAIAIDVLQARESDATARGLHIDAAISPAILLGDARLVERLVSNLVQNALRYNLPGGRVEMAVGTWAGQAALKVANTGPLVPAGEIERLLQPFQRLTTDRAGEHDGCGLGLSIVAAIARAHDADLGVRPAPGGGLHVEVTFPAPPAIGASRRRSSQPAGAHA
jgi:signal transduction histidine kinase